MTDYSNLTIPGDINGVFMTELDLVVGDTATATTINDGGIENVLLGATTKGTTVNSGGNEDVWSGGRVTGTTVNNGGTESLNSGQAVATTVNSGGALFENSNESTASSTTVNSGGTLYVEGTTTGTVLNGGAEVVFFAGVTSGTTVNSGGIENVSDGGTANGPAPCARRSPERAVQRLPVVVPPRRVRPLRQADHD
jgi:autotransporter passenger strand-loop-strand repeat protein